MEESYKLTGDLRLLYLSGGRKNLFGQLNQPEYWKWKNKNNFVLLFSFAPREKQLRETEKREINCFFLYFGGLPNVPPFLSPRPTLLGSFPGLLFFCFQLRAKNCYKVRTIIILDSSILQNIPDISDFSAD